MSMYDMEHETNIEQEVGSQFSTAVVLFHSAVAERLGVNVTDWKFARILTKTGPTNPGKLSELTGMTTPATAQVINRLERSGIVKRERDPNDKRKVIVDLVSNPKMEQTLKMIFSEFEKEMSAMMEKYTFSEKDVIRSFVSNATEIFEKQASKLRKENS